MHAIDAIYNVIEVLDDRCDITGRKWCLRKYPTGAIGDDSSYATGFLSFLLGSKTSSFILRFQTTGTTFLPGYVCNFPYSPTG